MTPTASLFLSGFRAFSHCAEMKHYENDPAYAAARVGPMPAIAHPNFARRIVIISERFATVISCLTLCLTAYFRVLHDRTPIPTFINRLFTIFWGCRTIYNLTGVVTATRLQSVEPRMKIRILLHALSIAWFSQQFFPTLPGPPLPQSFWLLYDGTEIGLRLALITQY